jgi:hypothetical protein
MNTLKHEVQNPRDYKKNKEKEQYGDLTCFLKTVETSDHSDKDVHPSWGL